MEKTEFKVQRQKFKEPIWLISFVSKLETTNQPNHVPAKIIHNPACIRFSNRACVVDDNLLFGPRGD